MKPVTLKAVTDISDNTLGVKGHTYFHKGDVFGGFVDGNVYRVPLPGNSGTIYVSRSEVERLPDPGPEKANK